MGINKVENISTKRGDTGTSRDYSNLPYPKDDVLFEILGTIDELSAVLGIAYHHTKYEQIKVIQKTLQAINALIATHPENAPESYEGLRKIGAKDIEFIETEEEKMLITKEIEPKFHLPGTDTTLENAYFDYARTVCRRAERTMVRFINTKARDDLDHPRAYLNRLSDLLFILARNFQGEIK
ncbi:MAG: ATP:cob(I)alamin adenosyltransferase [Bacillota bacterium]